MPTHPLICEIRYELDPERLEEFAEYARTWMRLIRKHGGVHHGFFMPRQAPTGAAMSFAGLGSAGPANEAVALFAFADDEAYRRYREAVAVDPEGVAANARFVNPPFKSYRRLFLEPVGE